MRERHSSGVRRAITIAALALAVGTSGLAPSPGGANPQAAPGGTWRPTAAQMPASGDALFVSGINGDYLSAGRDTTLTAADGDFSAVVDDDGSIRVLHDADPGTTRVTLRPPVGRSLTTGWHATVERRADTDPALAEMSIGLNGRGCNFLGGWFQIDVLDLRDGVLRDLDVRFEVRCERWMPLARGQLRWSASDVGSEGPDEVVAAANGDGAEVSWAAQPGAVLGHEITVFRDGLAIATQVAAPLATSAQVPGLEADRAHQFAVRAVTPDGLSRRSELSNRVVTGAAAASADPADLAFVEQIYRDLLGRRPDVAGRDHWLGRLAAGASRGAVTSALARSPEQRQRAVTRLHTQLHRRLPTSAERDALALFLAAPNGYDQVAAHIAGSPERVVDSELAATRFDDIIYRDVVRRDPQPADSEAVWSALDEGRSHASVALTVLTSAEARSQAVDQIYRRLLGRASDDSGRRFWAGQLTSGRSPEQVLAALTATEEYARRSVVVSP